MSKAVTMLPTLVPFKTDYGSHSNAWINNMQCGSLVLCEECSPIAQKVDWLLLPAMNRYDHALVFHLPKL